MTVADVIVRWPDLVTHTIVGTGPSVAGVSQRGYSSSWSIFHGGPGRITDTVTYKHNPSNVPVARKVRLFRDRDAVCVAETWSDATTGIYTFTGLMMGEKYTALSYDHTGEFESVCASNLVPV